MAMRRGVGVVLTILILGILVSVGGMVMLFLMVGRPPSVATNSVLTLRVEGDLEETSCPVGAFAAGPYNEQEEEIVTERLRNLGYM